MKTNYPLLARIVQPANLQAAWMRVRGKGSAGGIDGARAEDLASGSGDWLQKLHEELTAQTYVPEPLLRLSIPKPSKPKEKRVLALPTVRDKVAQEAVRRVIEPVLDRGFSDCSYGYRPGKGPQKAVRRVLHYIENRRCKWVVTADIDDFFGSLNQECLIGRLGGVLQDQAVTRLVELWLKMGTVDPRGRWRDVYSGVGQGGVISPLLANFYLDPFDRFLTSENQEFGLVRYSDDFVVLTQSRALAEEAMEKTTRFLREELFLRLNSCDRPVVSVPEGFTFLGLGFEGATLRIAPDKREKIERKLQALCSRIGTEPLERTIKAINESVVGWKRYYGPLVPTHEMERIQGFLAAALGGRLRHCFERGVFRTVGDAMNALGRLELPSGSDPRERRKLARQLVHQARAVRGRRVEESSGRGPASAQRRKLEASPAPTSPREKANAAAGDPPGGAVREAPSQDETGSSPPPAEAVAGKIPRQSVAAAVRRRKNRHFRDEVQRSELLLTTPGTFLGRSGERLVMRRERRIIHEMPSLHVSAVTIADHGISLSSDVIAYCAEHAIPLLVVDSVGRVKALLSAPESGAAELHLRQLRALQDPDRSFSLARQFVLGKVKNQRNLALYLGKYHRKANAWFRETLEILIEAGGKICAELKGLSPAMDDSFRGRLLSIEGRFASYYWHVFAAVLNGKAEFPGRQRRGAKDVVNSLLNYGYAVLESRVHLALLKAGLNPHVSFLHALQHKKPTLCYDLMEEFRPQVVDRTVASVITRREPIELDKSGCLTLDTRKLLIRRLQDRLVAVVRFQGRELKLNEIIQHQAGLLAGHLLGRARYRPFVGTW